MDHSLSTHLLVQHRLTTVWLDRIQQLGIPQVEIFCARQHLDYHNKAQVAELAAWFADSPLKLLALHGPMHNDDRGGRTGPDSWVSITERVKSKRIVMVDEIKRALETVERIPCRYFVQHLGNPNEEFSEHALDAAFTALDELNLFARARGVEILLENIPNELSNGEKLNYFLGITHLKNGYCFDVGHAHLFATATGTPLVNEFDLMRDRIRHTHVHGNNGVDDKHRFPFLNADDTVDWRAVMQRFRANQDKFALNLELKEQPDIAQPLEGAREVLERLEEVRTDD